MKIEAARRLLQASLFTETEVVLRAVIQYMRDNGHDADYTDDDHDMIVVNADIADAVETMDAHRFTVENEHQDVAGTVRCGKVVIMSGLSGRRVRLLQVGANRVVISLEKA